MGALKKLCTQGTSMRMSIVSTWLQFVWASIVSTSGSPGMVYEMNQLVAHYIIMGYSCKNYLGKPHKKYAYFEHCLFGVGG